jgi:hypothetical protein
MARVTGERPEPGTETTLVVSLPQQTVRLECIVRRVLDGVPPEFSLGLEFAPGQRAILGRLAVALFNGGARTSSAEAPAYQPVAA